MSYVKDGAVVDYSAVIPGATGSTSDAVQASLPDMVRIIFLAVQLQRAVCSFIQLKITGITIEFSPTNY